MKNTKNKASGFTLVEIGVVLAIIGVLAAISVPSVSYFLRQGRVKSVVGSINGIKNWIGTLQTSGATGGSLPVTEGVRPPCLGAALLGQDAGAVANAARLDQILVSAGICDQPLRFAMGNQAAFVSGEGSDLEWSLRRRAFFMNDGSGAASATATVTRDWSACSRLEARYSVPSQAPSSALGANFRLDGASNLPANAVVAYVLLKEVPFKDAVELALAVNGEALTLDPAAATGHQEQGAVVFQRPAAGAATTDVYIYIAHL